MGLGYAKVVATLSDTVDRRERDNREPLELKDRYEADMRASHERVRQNHEGEIRASPSTQNGPPEETMSYDPRQSYTVEAVPLTKPERHYGWAIRLHGKLLERSDRFYRSEEEALKAGSEALDREASAPADKR